MRAGVRSKLFVASLAVMVLVGGLCALYLERSLRAFLDRQVESHLAQQARTVDAAVASGSPETLGGLVGRLAAAGDARVTVIAPDGRVLADSAVPMERIGEVDNHAARPEVQTAKERGIGSARRVSRTIGQPMLYVAVQGDGRIVRTATPLEGVEEMIGRLRWVLVVAAAFGLVLASLLSLLASHFLSRALRRLVDHARVLVSGKGHRIEMLGTDEIGRLAGSFNQLADELEGAMRTLALERARFEAILDSMSDAVMVLDDRQRVLLVNPATVRLLGLDYNPVQKHLLSLVDLPPLAALAHTGATRAAQADLQLPGHPPRAVLARAAPLEATGGTVVVMHDVTEVRRLENVRKDFVANVSHELRTPVSIIQANAETLLDGALSDPARGRGFVEALHRNAERLSRIIADLLDLSRLEAGRYHFDISDVDLCEAVENAVDVVADRAASRKQTLEVAIPDDQELSADQKALEQVLTNLLENAIKYTPDGGHVAVRAETRGALVRIEVQDDGPGIHPEHRARIFERFYRIDPGRSREMGGTGLGLSIVKHFVESMGGRAGVDPAFPRGSVFWITLPLARSDTADVA